MTVHPQAAAEASAFERVRYQYGQSFRQGHRTGWREAIEWIIRSHHVQWEARVYDVWPRLLIAGIIRTPRDVDNAIQSAVDALHTDEGGRRDPDSDRHWEVLEPHVWRFLDLTPTELAAVA